MPRRSSEDRESRTDAFAEGLGRAIKVLRTSQDLSRRDLAERSGLSYSYLSEIENGTKSLSSRALVAIAEGLGLPTDELVRLARQWSSESPEPTSPELRDVLAGMGTDFMPRAEQQTRMRRLLRAPPLEESVSETEPPARDAASTPDRGGRALILDEYDTPAFLTTRMSDEPDSPASDGVPAELIAEIEAGNCVVFVGAGFSAAAGLPGWGDLLQRVAGRRELRGKTAEYIAGRVEHGTADALYEAAQLLEDKLGQKRFHKIVQRELSRSNLPPAMARRVRLLHGIPFRLILTTNIDGILLGEATDADAYRSALRPASYHWWEERYWDERQGAITLNLHGDISRSRWGEEPVVLTRRDYRSRLYEDPAYATFLRAIMATKTVLYLGFSFEDAYLNELRSEILALLGQESGSNPVAYAVVNDVPDEAQHHFRRHEGIEVLSYDTHGERDYSGFDRYLEEIHRATNPLLRFARYLEHKRILWIDPHPENNDLAFQHLRRAAEESGREQTALVLAPTADDGVRQLASPDPSTPFDLVITHWGDGQAHDEDGRPTSAAERLLAEIRRRDIRCPVVIFGSPEDAEHRKRTALGLGAQAYCFRFEELIQTIERVLAPGRETG